MDNKIIMHVNYCEQGQSIEDICKKAVKWGFDGVEFRCKRVNENETIEEYLTQIKKYSEKYGLEHVLFGGPGPFLMTRDENRRKEEMEYMIKFYKRASELFDLSVCNIFSGPLLNPSDEIEYMDCHKHGSFIATEEHYEWVKEGFKKFAKLAEEKDINFGFETHINYLHDSVESTMKIVDMLDSPNIGVNLDYLNITNLKNAPTFEETVESIGDKLFYVHLKNKSILAQGVTLRTGLGEGDYNNREFLRILKNKGYKGFLCIEAPRSGDREWYAQQDFEYIKSVIEDLKEE